MFVNFRVEQVDLNDHHKVHKENNTYSMLLSCVMMPLKVELELQEELEACYLMMELLAVCMDESDCQAVTSWWGRYGEDQQLWSVMAVELIQPLNIGAYDMLIDLTHKT